MFDYPAFDDTLRRLVAEGSGLPIVAVIPEQENAPAPSGLYATVHMMEESRPAWPSTRLVATADGQVEELISITIHGRFDVQFFRAGALNAAQRFRLWLEGSLGVMAMRRISVALVDRPVFRRLDEMLPMPPGVGNSVDIEERAGIELVLAYCTESRAEVGCIEAAPIRADHDGAAVAGSNIRIE